MILQALVRAYEALAADGRLDKPGWLEAKVSWSLELDEDGRLKRIYPVGESDAKGKRTVRAMKLPEMVKRSSGVAANFLCDNANKKIPKKFPKTVIQSGLLKNDIITA